MSSFTQCFLFFLFMLFFLKSNHYSVINPPQWQKPFTSLLNTVFAPVSLYISLYFCVSITVSSSQFPAFFLPLHFFPISFYLSQKLMVKNSIAPLGYFDWLCVCVHTHMHACTHTYTHSNLKAKSFTRKLTWSQKIEEHKNSQSLSFYTFVCL